MFFILSPPKKNAHTQLCVGSDKKDVLGLIVACLEEKCNHEVEFMEVPATVQGQQITIPAPKPVHYLWMATVILWIKSALSDALDEERPTQSTAEESATQSTPTKHSRSSVEQPKLLLDELLVLLKKKPPVHQEFHTSKGWNGLLRGLQGAAQKMVEELVPSGGNTGS